jgi:hypothetical protein
MALISVTRLRVRSPRYLPGFLWLTVLSLLQAKRAPGCLAVKLLRDANSTFWTNTAWHDETAMRAFMLAGAHRRAMPRLLEWCDEASVVHWHQDTAELPDWQEAHRRMVTEGRRSKVHHPSPAQTAYEIPQPKH